MIFSVRIPAIQTYLKGKYIALPLETMDQDERFQESEFKSFVETLSDRQAEQWTDEFQEQQRGDQIRCECITLDVIS